MDWIISYFQTFFRNGLFQKKLIWKNGTPLLDAEFHSPKKYFVRVWNKLSCFWSIYLKYLNFKILIFCIPNFKNYKKRDWNLKKNWWCQKMFQKSNNIFQIFVFLHHLLTPVVCHITLTKFFFSIFNFFKFKFSILKQNLKQFKFFKANLSVKIEKIRGNKYFYFFGVRPFWTKHVIFYSSVRFPHTRNSCQEL